MFTHSPARGTKHLSPRTTPLQLTCILLPLALILCLLTVLLQGNQLCWCWMLMQTNVNLFTEHTPTLSLISLNKPKKMPTRFEKYYKSDEKDLECTQSIQILRARDPSSSTLAKAFLRSGVASFHLGRFRCLSASEMHIYVWISKPIEN